MNKKIFPIIFLVLLLFAVIKAVTDDAPPEQRAQRAPLFIPSITKPEDRIIKDNPDWLKPARWFRSNAGGIALEETQSRFVAFRNEYALAVINARDDELPDFLAPYYQNDFLLEIRVLYRNTEQIKTQWVFRDANGITRLNAVFIYEDEETELKHNKYIAADEEADIDIDFEDSDFNEVEYMEINNNDDDYNDNLNIVNYDEYTDINISNKTGFIEIFNEESVLTAEYKFNKDGSKNKIEYEVKENLLIRAVYSVSEGGIKSGYRKAYEDFYRYNRSLSLRSIERVFHTDTIEYEKTVVNFKSKILESANNDNFLAERLNVYPEYFGDVFINKDSKMIYNTDERGRIILQTLYDEDGNIIWVIQNTWLDNRIISTNKTEDDLILMSEYEYDAAGERILEKNYKNGMLERTVKTSGNTDIEELYIDNKIVLRAVWEDGIMISETRVKN